MADEYIKRETVNELFSEYRKTSCMNLMPGDFGLGMRSAFKACNAIVSDAPAADVAPVVRCQNCIHAEPLDRNCEINTSVYMHCKIQRGTETQNVWHKYKKYYKDYSLVDRDGFCDEGERMDGE